MLELTLPSLDETKSCPQCGKRMIQREGHRYESYSDDGRYITITWKWWCGCQHYESGGIVCSKTSGQIERERWQAAQDEWEHRVSIGDIP